MELSTDARTVRGLSIAVTIFGALALILGVIGLAFAPAISTIMTDPELGLESEAVSMVSSMYTAIMVIYVILNILVLVAGILGLNCVNDRDKLNTAFIFAIVGAVASLLCGEVVQLVLLIILAVFENKLKKEPTIVTSYGQPYGAPNGYGQPYNGQQYGNQQQLYDGQQQYGNQQQYSQSQYAGQPYDQQYVGQQQQQPYGQPDYSGQNGSGTQGRDDSGSNQAG